MAKKAELILGQDYLGPEAIDRALGIHFTQDQIPVIPFNQDDLERARELQQFLILRTDKLSSGQSLTITRLNLVLQKGFSRDGMGRPLRGVNPYIDQDTFIIAETPRPQWALVSKNVIPDSRNKNYLGQTQALADYLIAQVFESRKLPVKYQELIKEFDDKKPDNLSIYSDKKDEDMLFGLGLNQLTRHSAVEAFYDLMLYFQHTGVRLLPYYTWTNSLDNFKPRRPIRVGHFDQFGVVISSEHAYNKDNNVGVLLSRSK